MIDYWLRQRYGKLNLSAFMMAIALYRGEGPFKIISNNEMDAKHFMSLVENHLKNIIKDDTNVTEAN